MNYMKRKNISLFYGFLLLIFSYNLNSQIDIFKIPDQIACNYFPKKSDDYANTCTGRGLWHGYTIPTIYDTEHLGQFGGPYCYYTNKWLAESLLKVEFSVGGIGNIVLASADEISISQFPTHLIQSFQFQDYKLEAKLSYISHRTSVIEVFAINTSQNNQKFNISVGGSIFPDVATADKFTDGWMIKPINNDKLIWLVRVKVRGELDFAYSNSHYQLSYRMLQEIKPNDTLSLTIAISQYFIGDTQQDMEITNNALENPDSFLNKNINWWNFILGNFNKENPDYAKISAKAFQTIMLNLRSNLPGFTNFTFKNGSGKRNLINTDEAWFVSSSLVLYDTKLALHNLLSVLLRHNPDGSFYKYIPINDSLYINKQIYQKPLLVWSIWNAFTVNPQPDIIKNTINIIEKCHNYWYEKRDIDFNGYCEDDSGFESVILNAMLFNEKHYLKNIYKYLHDSINEKKYQIQIDKMIKEFNYKFFNPEDAHYYDFNPQDSMWYSTDEVIGYVMWAGLASWDIARIIVENEIRPKIESGYYKNVNIYNFYDPAYFFFLNKGLISYGFKDEAEKIKKDIKENILKTFSKGPINYYIDIVNDIKIENSSYLAACIIIYLNYI